MEARGDPMKPRNASSRRPWLVAALALAAAGALGMRLTDTAKRHIPAAAIGDSCNPLSAAAKRGRFIFSRGRTAGGVPVEGLLGDGPASLTGREAACAGCHSPSGEGGEEGGFAVPAIAPENLFRPVIDRGARDRPAHDGDSLARTIRQGVAPTGRRLALVMPRYRIDDRDLGDLLAYLRCVGHDEADPGVSAQALRIGAALPLSGPLATAGEDVRHVLLAHFADINAQGGIFGRKLELVVEDSGSAAGATNGGGAISRLLDAGVFAIVGSVYQDDRAVKERVNAAEVPLIAPVGRVPVEQNDHDGFIFYVHPDAETLARIAMKHIVDSVAGDALQPVLVLHSTDEAGRGWFRGAERETLARGGGALVSLSFAEGDCEPASMRKTLLRERPRAILFAGSSADVIRCASALVEYGRPVYAPGWMVRDAALVSARVTEMFFVYPEHVGETFDRGMEELSVFARQHGIPMQNSSFQREALVAGKILVEALRRVGLRSTRAGLTAALQSMRDFDTGFVPPVSFGKRRRIGIMGARLIQAGPSGHVRASNWMTITP